MSFKPQIFPFVLDRITAYGFGMMNRLWRNFLCVCVCINVHWKWVTWTRPRAVILFAIAQLILRDQTSQASACWVRWGRVLRDGWCHWVWTSFALVSLGTLPTMQWKRRRRVRESLCAGIKSAAASGKFCTLPQYAWQALQGRQSCLSSPHSWHHSIRH